MSDEGVTIIQDENSNVVHDWKPVTTARNYRLESDRVYVNITRRLSCANKVSFDVCVSFGRDIYELIQFIQGARVELFVDQNNPYFIKLKKSEGNKGYKIISNKKSEILRTTFRIPSVIFLQETSTVECDFDLFTDSSILLNLTKLKG